jgi:hypothetical protein
MFCKPRMRFGEARATLLFFSLYCLEQAGRWLCAVVKQLTGEGFLITAYPTDAIKEGERI